MSHSQQRQRLRGMNAWDRHKQLMSDYQAFYGGRLPSQPVTVKTDMDSLIEQHRFIRRPEDDHARSWEAQLAKRYYAKLYKEYAIIDLARYKEGLYGMRWRSKQEVLDGKGHFQCGAKGCEERQGLCSFEVPFAYIEADARRDALVKVRLCPKHALQLNYRKNKEVLKLQRAEHKRQQRRKHKADSKRRKVTRDQLEASKCGAEGEPEASGSSDQLDANRRESSTSAIDISSKHARRLPDEPNIPSGSKPVSCQQHHMPAAAERSLVQASQQQRDQQQSDSNRAIAGSSHHETTSVEDAEDAALLIELLI